MICFLIINYLLVTLLFKNKSLFSTFKVSLKCKKKLELHYSGSSHKRTPSGREGISVTRADH